MGLMTPAGQKNRAANSVSNPGDQILSVDQFRAGSGLIVTRR